MLLPANIVDEVEQILTASPNYLSAYQILEQLPTPLRNQMIKERGLPGLENGNSYTAASAVSDAAEMLRDRPGYDRQYCEGRNILFEISGHTVRAGNSACAFYRIRP